MAKNKNKNRSSEEIEEINAEKEVQMTDTELSMQAAIENADEAIEEGESLQEQDSTEEIVEEEVEKEVEDNQPKVEMISITKAEYERLLACDKVIKANSRFLRTNGIIK